MFYRRLALRRFAVVLLAAALAVPGTLAAAGEGAGQQQCEREGHACVKFMVSCCCDGQQQPVPASSPSGRTTVTGLNFAPSTVPAFLVVPADADRLSSAARRVYSPPHGYHSTDLSMLLSTLLI